MSSNSDLVDCFLELEPDHVQSVIDQIEGREAEFDTNMFHFEIDRESNTIEFVDICLMGNPSSPASYPIDEVLQRLRAHQSR